MRANPHAEVLAVCGEEFLRYDGDVVFEEDDTLANAILAANPAFQRVYNEQTGLKLGMFHLKKRYGRDLHDEGQKEVFEVWKPSGRDVYGTGLVRTLPV